MDYPALARQALDEAKLLASSEDRGHDEHGTYQKGSNQTKEPDQSRHHLDSELSYYKPGVRRAGDVEQAKKAEQQTDSPEFPLSLGMGKFSSCSKARLLL